VEGGDAGDGDLADQEGQKDVPKTGGTQRKKRGRSAVTESAHKPKTTRKAQQELERMVSFGNRLHRAGREG
jgi:hypothetical protein